MGRKLTIGSILHELDINSSLNYSTPKLYVPKTKNSKGKLVPNLKKRWYVYVYFRNPKTNKKEPHKYYAGINRLGTAKERYEFGDNLIKGLKHLLKNNYSPYNLEAYDIDDDGLNDTLVDFSEYGDMSVSNAIDYALKAKKTTIKESTYGAYRIKANVFKEWLDKVEMDKSIALFSFNDALRFLNWIRDHKSKGNSVATTVHNYKREISSLFGKLKSDKIIRENPFADIETKSNKPKRHKPLTDKEVEKIKAYLLKYDKQLYYFIAVMSYSFLRNREVLKLTVGDVNLTNKVLSIDTKTESIAYKILLPNIEKILVDVFKVNKKPKEHFIFTDVDFKTGEWSKDYTMKYKLKHYSERFKRVKKSLGLAEEVTIYSFRHTIIRSVFKHLIDVKGMNEREAIYELQSITGHNSEVALRKYLREIGAILPKSIDNMKVISF